MSGEVNWEADAHDEVDHGYGVEIDIPQRHISNDSHLNWDDRERYPDRAENVRDEDEWDDHHNYGSDHHALHRSRSNQLELIEEHKVGVEDGYIDRSIFANVPQVFHHLLLVIGVGNVDGLYQKTRGDYARLVLVEGDV